MTQLRATRLKQPAPYRARGFLVRYLPFGSWQRKTVMYVCLPLTALLLFAGLIDGVVMPALTRHGTDIELPDMLGEGLATVETRLKELKLSFEIASEEYSPGKEQGIILHQYPLGGTRVKPGRTIKFVISLGQKMVSIPSMAGKSVRQAILDLETSGLALGEIAWAFSDTIPERIVVFSYPAASTQIPLGAPVNLMVNRGRASTFTYMPRLVGMPLSEASKKLEDKSLRMGVVTYRTDENFLPETILEQSEPEGAELDVGTEIDLVASSIE